MEKHANNGKISEEILEFFTISNGTINLKCFILSMGFAG